MNEIHQIHLYLPENWLRWCDCCARKAAQCGNSSIGVWRAEDYLYLKPTANTRCIRSRSAVYFLSRGVEHRGIINGPFAQICEPNISISRLPCFTSFVLGFTCKIFSNKTLGNKLLIACLVCLINVTLYWLRLAPMNVCAHDFHYAGAWLVLHGGTDGDDKRISAERDSSFVWSHPLLALSSFSAHCCLFVTPLSHQCGGVLWKSSTHNKPTVLFFLSVQHLCLCSFAFFMRRRK